MVTPPPRSTSASDSLVLVPCNNTKTNYDARDNWCLHTAVQETHYDARNNWFLHTAAQKTNYNARTNWFLHTVMQTTEFH